MKNSNIELRNKVLFYSLNLEAYSSTFLKWLLGIQDNDSISFGNTGKALSFDQKINLLIDIGSLQSSDKGKFQKFMEIRNQLMHNLKCNYLKDIFGVEKYLTKHYPSPETLTTIDEKLDYSFEKLVEDLFDIFDNIDKKVRQKLEIEVRKDVIFEQYNLRIISRKND